MFSAVFNASVLSESSLLSVGAVISVAHIMVAAGWSCPHLNDWESWKKWFLSDKADMVWGDDSHVGVTVLGFTFGVRRD